jgi:hypothetical protein
VIKRNLHELTSINHKVDNIRKKIRERIAKSAKISMVYLFGLPFSRADASEEQ